jgi:hypothetical protein
MEARGARNVGESSVFQQRSRQPPWVGQHPVVVPTGQQCSHRPWTVGLRPPLSSAPPLRRIGTIAFDIPRAGRSRRTSTHLLVLFCAFHLVPAAVLGCRYRVSSIASPSQSGTALSERADDLDHPTPAFGALVERNFSCVQVVISGYDFEFLLLHQRREHRRRALQ